MEEVIVIEITEDIRDPDLILMVEEDILEADLRREEDIIIKIVVDTNKTEFFFFQHFYNIVTFIKKKFKKA